MQDQAVKMLVTSAKPVNKWGKQEILLTTQDGRTGTVTLTKKSSKMPDGSQNTEVLIRTWEYENKWYGEITATNFGSPPQSNGFGSPQPAQNSPQDAQQPSQTTNQAKPNTENASYALSYVKDLVVAGKITLEGLPELVNDFKFYLDNGIWNKPKHSITDEPDDLPPGFGEEQPPQNPPTGDQIPF